MAAVAVAGAAACVPAVKASAASTVMLPPVAQRRMGVRSLILIPSTTSKVSAGPKRQTEVEQRG